MASASSMRRGLNLPGGVALILGLGAIATGGAQADAPEQANLAAFGKTLIRSEDGRIYLSEGGRETELRLAATPQRDRLLRLLEEHGPGGVWLDRDPRLIMSSGGGSGFYWWGTRKSASDKPSPALQNPPQPPASSTPGLNPGGSAPRSRNPETDKKE
jgi:hypothetical protein